MKHHVPPERWSSPSDPSRGLDRAEVEARRARFGRNDMFASRRAGWREVLRESARDPMPWFLLGISLLFALLGDHTEAVVLGLALLPILGMDAYLHRRSRASVEGLASRLAMRSRVWRDGHLVEVETVDLVPGDLVRVEASEYLPADGVIVDGEHLQLDESALTGESLPCRKHPWTGAMPEDAEIEDRHWGAAGTRLLTGSLQLRVVDTGARTLYGGIVRLAQTGPRQRTPLQQALSSLVTALVAVAVLMCVALALARWYQGHGLLDAVVSALTLAVAALPEEFPVVLTAFLGVGVWRLARHGALVQRAVAVENIGRVSAICTDKTGTLTEGRLQLRTLQPASDVDEPALLRVAARASREDSADPMDTAILERAGGAGGERAATFPFTEKARREVAVFVLEDGQFEAVAKGAPETVLAMCTLSSEEREVWSARAGEWAARGYKVIACARRALPAWPGGEPDREYAFAGLLGFADPLREGVAEAVAETRQAGIRVLMITGDHPLTARAIAVEAGLGGAAPTVRLGEDLVRDLRRDGVAALADLDAVARCLPMHKLEIVRALQAEGEIVAVTGDGVNDVPALQAADIGIAMGRRGTRTASEVAPVVLLDDNFGTLVEAIAEGRQLFGNLKLSFAYLLMIHMPLVLTAAFVPWLGLPLLYLPIHVVWLELIIHPTALLAFQQLPTRARLQRVRRTTRLRFFDAREWAVVIGGGLALTALVGVGYAYSLESSGSAVHARSMALLVLVVASAAVTLALGRGRTRAARIVPLAALASAIVLLTIPTLAAALQMQLLHADDWMLALAGGVLIGAVAALFHRSHRVVRAS
ncbi:cation-transporting P-type ATPase [Oleiagrimonas sp. MCCC 1A03011]|uniref:cation-translocating P-type ATPase n=1 Tax=Oleiagrimonas sp. MCCC 1A03011 TaxID=1926883 RepID=UPI000DC2C01D|nr:cation-transporting P-type ATPase [Oleiagrimonas sp. MCCC 1A03011]RAP56257.1 haloacid dehalogenase [Oleiagrimonas sp. MCCC 1A03011]